MNISEEMLTKFLIIFMLFSIFLSVKTIIFVNLNLIINDNDSRLSFENNWEKFYGNFLFLIMNIIISLLIGIKIKI